MALPTDDLRIVGLHKLPFDPQGFEKDMESVADHSPKIIEELRNQYRENWDSAWIIVIEAEGPPWRIDFHEFAHPFPGINPQGAYLEQILEYNSNKTRAAFFIHYVQIEEPLYYKRVPLAFPMPSPAPKELIERMKYYSPD
jgi:hypothetical protein